MNKRETTIIIRLCTAAGLASLSATLLDFFVLKKSDVYVNFKLISEHYGNELAGYYIFASISAVIILISQRNNSTQQMLLIWGLNLVFFSNQYADRGRLELIVVLAGISLLYYGIIKSRGCNTKAQGIKTNKNSSQ